MDNQQEPPVGGLFCGSHKGAHATRGGAHDTRRNREGARNAHVHHAQRWSNWAPRTRQRGGGGQVVDDEDNTWRGGATGPHAHGNMARHVVDDLNAEGEWAAKTVRQPPQQPAQCPVRHLLGPANAETAPHGTTAAHSDPTQHAKGRTRDCPGPRKETSTRRRGLTVWRDGESSPAGGRSSRCVCGGWQPLMARAHRRGGQGVQPSWCYAPTGAP